MPAIENPISGSGTASDPYVYYYSYEFTSTQVSDRHLPELTDSIACFFQPDNRVNSHFTADITDLTSSGIFTLVEATSDEDLATQSTSRAFQYNGIGVIVTLMGMISYSL